MYKGLKMFSNNFPNLREALLKFMQARPELMRNSSFCVLPKSGKSKNVETVENVENVEAVEKI